jgi:hypothetical protein
VCGMCAAMRTACRSPWLIRNQLHYIHPKCRHRTIAPPTLNSIDRQPVTLDFIPSNPRRINRLKASAPPHYLENPVSSKY